LQRCPLNSVEQFGQIEDKSFFGFAGSPPATPIATPSDLREPEAATEEFPAKSVTDPMPVVVAQIQLKKIMSLIRVGINQGTVPKSSRHKRLEAIV
jgi:hypothetical protein